MAFAARFASTCNRCDKPISVGQYIAWSRSAEKGKRSWHVDCSLPDATPAVITNEDSPDLNAEPLPVVSAEPSNPSNLMAGFASALMPYIESKLATKLDESSVLALVDKYIADNPLATPIRIEVFHPSGEVKPIENAHTMMPKLLYLIQKRHHSYLYGDPGSGKTTAARQAASALSLDYAYIALNPQTPESRLLGFIDANGVYRATMFRKLYENGGVFTIDEMDNASPALATTLNGGLENGHFAFPDGLVERHKDFVVVATGNTCGRGANYLFPERRPFDAAFSERFTFLEFQYDEKMERAAALAINPGAACKSWVAWVHKTRAFCKEHKVRLVVSPRVTFRGAEYLLDDTFNRSEIAEATLFKGIDRAIVKQVLDACPL